MLAEWTRIHFFILFHSTLSCRHVYFEILQRAINENTGINSKQIPALAKTLQLKQINKQYVTYLLYHKHYPIPRHDHEAYSR